MPVAVTRSLMTLIGLQEEGAVTFFLDGPVTSNVANRWGA
jgi:hypothetical protein